LRTETLKGSVLKLDYLLTEHGLLSNYFGSVNCLRTIR
jgi:hypothetical protein